jgi:hypothetical protein
MLCFSCVLYLEYRVTVSRLYMTLLTLYYRRGICRVSHSVTARIKSLRLIGSSSGVVVAAPVVIIRAATY